MSFLPYLGLLIIVPFMSLACDEQSSQTNCTDLSPQVTEPLNPDPSEKDSFIFKLSPTHNPYLDYQASADYLASDARLSINSPLTLDAPDPHSFSVKPTVNNPYLRDGQDDCQYVDAVFEHPNKQLSLGSDQKGNPCSRSHLTISDYQITTRFKYEE